MRLQHAKPDTSFAVKYGLAPPKMRTAPWPKNPVFDRDYVMALVSLRPGISDREIAEAVYGPGTGSDVVVQMCRALAAERAIGRWVRADGVFGNFLSTD